MTVTTPANKSECTKTTLINIKLCCTMTAILLRIFFHFCRYWIVTKNLANHGQSYPAWATTQPLPVFYLHIWILYIARPISQVLMIEFMACTLFLNMLVLVCCDSLACRWLNVWHYWHSSCSAVENELATTMYLCTNCRTNLNVLKTEKFYL